MAILTSGGERHATERRSESAARVICPPRRVNSVEQFGDAIVAMDVLLLARPTLSLRVINGHSPHSES